MKQSVHNQQPTGFKQTDMTIMSGLVRHHEQYQNCVTQMVPGGREIDLSQTSWVAPLHFTDEQGRDRRGLFASSADLFYGEFDAPLAAVGLYLPDQSSRRSKKPVAGILAVLLGNQPRFLPANEFSPTKKGLWEHLDRTIRNSPQTDTQIVLGRDALPSFFPHNMPDELVKATFMPTTHAVHIESLIADKISCYPPESD